LVKGLPEYVLKVVQTNSFTDAKLRAMTAVQNAADVGEGDLPDILLMMGGDGITSVGTNACAGTEVRLGVVPAGTGNDFLTGMGVPNTTEAALKVICSGVERKVDLTQVQGNLTGGAYQRYVGSTVGSGWDARVNLRTNRRRFSLGSLSYGYDALAELATFEPATYRLTIDGVEREDRAMMVVIGNAGVFGGGMRVCPFADPVDGSLDVTIVHSVSRFTMIRLLPSMYSGKFIKDPAVELLTASQVRLDGDDMYAMADGEELGDVPLDISCAHEVLWLLGADANSKEVRELNKVDGFERR
jgi:diacylglycerol kinase (ATP)